MPPTDPNRLSNSIRAYAAAEPVFDDSGRVIFSDAGADHVARLCEEIKYTHFPRRIVLCSANVPILEVLARHGRLTALSIGADETSKISCASGSDECAHALLLAVETALAECGPLTVSYHRLEGAREEDGVDLNPKQLLRLRAEATPIRESVTLPYGAQSAQLKLRGSEMDAAKGDEDGLSRLRRLAETTRPEMAQWIEALNDDIFEEIELSTSGGQTLNLSYDMEGVRLKLLG